MRKLCVVAFDVVSHQITRQNAERGVGVMGVGMLNRRAQARAWVQTVYRAGVLKVRVRHPNKCGHSLAFRVRAGIAFSLCQRKRPRKRRLRGLL